MKGTNTQNYANFESPYSFLSQPIKFAWDRFWTTLGFRIAPTETPTTQQTARQTAGMCACGLAGMRRVSLMHLGWSLWDPSEELRERLRATAKSALIAWGSHSQGRSTTIRA